ncbi:tetratricopeptide repeat protein [Candidatus Poribacteria bacterium]|nr:tetratricopeptide repeat protein [Candidatus Poribacteria bacterium]
MYRQQNIFIFLYILCLLVFLLCDNPIIFAQDISNDEQIIERYKLMLKRKPKEGSTFDRLYQFYLEGAGLDAMVSDYQAEAEANPNEPNLQLILGHIYKRLGRDTEAVNTYKRAVALAPDNYYTHFALGQAFAALLQHENAINSLKQSATFAEKTQDATPEEMTAIYKALGKSYFRRDRVDEAITAWIKIAEIDPQNIFARTELADLFIEQELYEQAITQHQAIIQLKTDDPYRKCLSQREIGNIYEIKGDYQKAIQSYDTALSLTVPGNWLRKDLQHRIIGIFATDSDWKGLIKYYQQKLETTPNEPELLGLLAAAYIENQQTEEGINVYRKGLELAPTDSTLRLNLIAALRNDEKFAEAATEYEVLSEQDPDDFGIYRELGELYIQVDDEDSARKTYQQMIDRDPNSASTYLTLAEIYTGNEWLEDAIAAYQKAISLAPNNLDYIAYFGEFYLRQGSRDKAIETWNMMVASNLGIAENYERLAKLLSTKNFHTEAITVSRKAVELKPDVYEYRKELAQRLMKTGEFEEAQKTFTEAAKLAPNAFFAEEMDNQRIELYRRQGTLLEKIEAVEVALEESGLTDTEIFTQQKRLAKMYLKLGNVTYALEVLLKAKADKPDDVIVNRWLAEVYIKQNRRDDANAIYMHLIQIDSANAREYYTNIAQSHLHVMDFEAATASAKQVIAHSPRNPEGHKMLAEIAKQSSNYDGAIDSLKQAIRLRPDAIDMRSELAAVYKLAEKPRQALAQYWRCWELSDSVSDKLSFVKPLSDTYYDLGQGSALSEKLKQLSKSNASGVAPVLALAELHRMEGDLPKARFQLARALDRQSDNPDLLSQLVNISLDLGDNQDALTYQERLVKAHPDPIHQRKLGELLFDAGREQEAIQAWTKLLHAKNQTLEAEVKLAILLIRHAHLDEALFVLDRAAEKITGTDAHIALFQLGVVLVKMNEYERARTHFQRILEMPKPQETADKKRDTYRRYNYDPPGINTRKFDLADDLLYDIQDQSYRGSNVQGWMPKNFDEAQAGALVHLVTISQQEGKLNEFIQQYETNLNKNPKDIKTLETLAQIYTLTENTKKTDEIIEQLIAASPKDTTYQAIRLRNAIQRDYTSETLEQYLNNTTDLTEASRLWFTFQYIQKRYLEGEEAEAEKLINEIEDTNGMNLDTIDALIETLVLMKKTDAAERFIAKLPIPTQTQQSTYRYIYSKVTHAYLKLGQYDKAVNLFWTYLEKTRPEMINTQRVPSLPLSTSSSSSSSIQTIFPTSTAYYKGSRLWYLKSFSRELWMNNQQMVLYEKLQTVFDATDGRDRIFPGLALSYCYWWNGRREKAQEILVSLQNEFPHDQSLKLNTVFLAIQSGQQAGTIKLLEELTISDPRNRSKYYELTLKLAMQTGNSVAIRDLIVKLLNTPSSAHELYNYSMQLKKAGYSQYASAIMNKTVKLAMGVQDASFLMDISRHLENLGRGQDAAMIAERALRFANRRDRYGRTLSSWKLQQATHLTSHSESIKDHEIQLIEAARKNPNSHKAQIKLAAFYEGTERIEKATDAFKTALTLRPKDSDTRKRYAALLYRSGKYEDAIPQYTKLLQDNPSILGYDTWDVIETFFRAKRVDELVSLSKDMITPSIGRDYNNELARDVASELRDTNNHKAAIEIYEKLIEAQPSDSYYIRYMAGAYTEMGEYEKAIQILRDLLKIEDSLYWQKTTISLLTRYYRFSGGLEEFITEYEAKLAEKPADNNLRYLVATMKFEANDLDGADELTLQLLDEDTFNTLNRGDLTSLADAYRLAGLRERELQILEYIVKNQQGYWTTYNRLGMIYGLRGETEKAQDAYRKMGRLKLQYRNDYIDLMNLGSIYMQNLMWDDAEPLFIQIVNDLSVQSYYRSQAADQLVGIKRRRTDFNNSTQLNDKIQSMDIGTLRTLAKDFARRGDRKKAITLYTHLQKIMPEDFESRAHLASIYTTQNQYDNAVATWESLLAEDPGNSKFQDGLVRTYQKAGNINKAIEIAQHYIDRDSDNSVNYIRIAKLYADADRTDDAITAYKKAVEINPGNAELYQEMATLYLRKEDVDAAKQAYQEAIRYTGSEWERQDIEQEIIKLTESKENSEDAEQKMEEDKVLTYAQQKARADKLREDGKLTEASTTYEKALEMTTDSFEQRRIYEYLIDIYPKVGNDDAAIEMHDMLAFSMGIYNAEQRARDRLINAYDSASKLDILTTIYKTKLENDPKNIKNMEMLAETYKKANDHAKTAEMYQAIIKLQPNNIISYYWIAAAYNRDGQSDLAKQMLSQGESVLSVSDRKSDRYFLKELGDICYDGRLYDSAIKLAYTAIAESIGTRLHGVGSPAESAYELLAKSYLAAKRYEEAVYAYQQLVNLPGSGWRRDEARRAIESASKLGKLYDKQIPKLLKQVQENPDDAEVRLTLAQTYEKADKPDESITHYEKLSQLQPNDVRWQKKLGDLYKKERLQRSLTGQVYENIAVQLDGNANYVEVENSDSLRRITRQATISFWMKPTAFPNRYAPIISKGDERQADLSNRSYTLHLEEQGKIHFSSAPRGRGQRQIYTDVGTIQLNQWYHITGVIDATRNSIKLYVNGIELGNNTLSGQQSFYESHLPLRIGWTHEIERPTHSPFVGLIDDVRIWNIARRGNQIRSDMNTELKGDEQGLVAYWKFNGATDGMVLDATPNKNHGRIFGNAKFTSYSRPIFESAKSAQLTKASAAYEKAVKLDPTSYELYTLLAETYDRSGQSSKAEEVYLRALDAPLTERNHDDAIQAIWSFYENRKDQDKGIAILEGLKQRQKNSVVLYQLLGDVYRSVGDTDKSDHAYTQWIELRRRQLNQQGSGYQDFAEELIKKEMFPAEAIEFAKRAVQHNSNYTNILTLGYAYLADGQNDIALEEFKKGLKILKSGSFQRKFFSWIFDYGEKIEDKETYVDMLNELVNVIPDNLIVQLNLSLLLADFCLKNDMQDKARAYIQKTGFITEDAWLYLGPFDNTSGIGHDTAYIQEDITQIDMNKKYDADNKKISWNNLPDDKLDGFINMGEGRDWEVAYAFTTIVSPDAREVQFRFDSDDQGKIWLNGERVYARRTSHPTEIDRYVFPVTLKQGTNSLLIKVCEESGGWGFYLRITDEHGKPYQDLQFRRPDTGSVVQQ